MSATFGTPRIPRTDISRTEAFSVGRVLSRSASIFSHGLVPLVTLTAIVHVPLFLIVLLAPAVISGGASRGFFFAAGFTPILTMIISSLTTATCLFGAYQIMRGREFSVRDSLGVALGRFWPVLGASLLGGLFTGLLSMLLLVPGIIYLCAIYVALPACVIERIGPWASLRRSRELTKGYRWSIFGLVLLLGLAGALIGYGAAYVAHLLLGYMGGAIARLVAQIVFGAFASVVYAVVYYDLRSEREGVDIDQISSVFD